VALSPTGFFALITKFSCLNAYCSQHCQPIVSVPNWPSHVDELIRHEFAEGFT
jgi:hypothetical protein